MVPGPVVVDDDDPVLDEVERWGLQGQLQQALAVMQRLGPAEQLNGVRARCTLAWLWGHLGGSRRATRWHVAEYRRSPLHPSAVYFYAYDLLRSRGPVEGWLFLQDYQVPASAKPGERADIASLRARLLAYLGDHRAADAQLAAADSAVLGEPRAASTRATLLERREKRAEARELLVSALSRQPRHRVLVHHLAMLLEAENEPEQALELLTDAESTLDAPVLTGQRAALLHHLGRFEEETRCLDRYERLSTHGDRDFRRELAALRAENCYRRGDVAGFKRFAEHSGNEYFERLAARLPAHAGAPDRKLLSLPVVLQEPMGCAPASLAIVSRYFGAAVDHVDVADQICYEGTASHSERRWVEQRGWCSREFTVDFSTAQALIERGVPFLLVTVDIASAHAQVVVGFDRTRQTLLTRDPMGARVGELDAVKLFERHKAYGPRGHVLLPPHRLNLLDGLDLPETSLHDASHALRVAAENNDGALVQERLAALAALAPEHPLTLWARRMLAQRDGDPYAIKACSEALLQRFPDDANASLSVLDCLASIGTEAEQETRIRERLQDGKDAPWIYYEKLAQLLGSHAEKLPAARRALRRAERRVPTRGWTIALRAQIEQDAGNSRTALCLRRVASTLEPTDDGLARAYFGLALQHGEAEVALQLLRDRADRYQSRSGEPVCVLFSALEWLDREKEAFEVLEGGLQRRPQDGPLLLFAAEAHARYRRHDLARGLLERARGKVPTASLERSAARLAEVRGDLHEALARQEAVLAAQPLAMQAQEAAAGLRSELFGFERAREELAAVCASYPAHCGLRELYATWLRGHDPALVLPELDALLTVQPAHAWARRERALVLSDLGQHEAALQEAKLAEQQMPWHPASQRVLATVSSAAGRREQALGPARKMLELWPDGPGCVIELVRLAGSLPEQLELLRWSWKTVVERSTGGEGLLEWRGYAAGLLEPAELQALVAELFEKRPALWASHLLLARERLLAGDAGEARRLLLSATQRFSAIPRLQLDLAEAQRACGDLAGETEALRAALDMNPAWTACVLRLAECTEVRRDPAQRRHILERGLRFHPRSSSLRLSLAHLAFEQGEPALALRHAREAVECEPEDGEAWHAYAEFARHLRREDDVPALAEQLAEQRPWNATIWLRLAEIYGMRAENQESIGALERALERRPTSFDALDTLAETLARVGKRDEALALCETPLSNYFSRGALRARRAWVLWQFGDAEGACAAMRAMLQDHPDQLWGLQELVGWEQERQNFPEAARLSRRLVALAPRRAMGHRFLGEALLAMMDEEGAWDALSDAARLDPSYAYAGAVRVDLAIRRRHFDDAREVIAAQGDHVPPATRDFWELSLVCAQRDEAGASVALRRLATRPTTRGGVLEACAAPLSRLPLDAQQRVLRELLEDPASHAELGALWVSALSRSGASPSTFAVRRLSAVHPAAAETAVRRHFELMGDASASGLRLLGALLVLGPVARQNDQAWGQVGYALLRARAYVLGELWLSDYARRSDAEAWMLHNYCVAALENHRHGAAHRAAERALELPTDATLPRHMALAAFSRAVKGDVAGAHELLEGRTPHGLSERYALLFEAAALLVELARTPVAERRPVLAQLGRLDLSRSGVKAAELISGGTLQRLLAAGVLRQQYTLGFFIMRWLLVIILLALVLGYFYAPDPDWSTACGLLLAGLPIGYLLWRRAA